MGKFLWVDLEMSGLLVESCRILEVAAIVTDDTFQELGTFARIVKQPKFVLAAMDDWCTKTHGESGLSAAVLQEGVPEGQVEQDFLAFIDQHFASSERPVLAGNSISQDRLFIDYYWKKVARRLHYRMLDVTSYKLLFQGKFGIEFKKQGNHRAIDDIRESISELKHYLSFVKVNTGV